MTEPWTDCPPCPWCRCTTGCPQMADQAGHHWDGRHRTYDPRALVPAPEAPRGGALLLPLETPPPESATGAGSGSVREP